MPTSRPRPRRNRIRSSGASSPGAAMRSSPSRTRSRGRCGYARFARRSRPPFAGSRSPPDFTYRQGAAALGLIDAYRAGGDTPLVEPSRRAIALLVRAQKPGAGWRYTLHPTEADSAVTAWITLAFESAKRVNDAD